MSVLLPVAEAGHGVEFTVMYPESNLAPGSQLYLRGSPPLSWDVPQALSQFAPDTWVAAIDVTDSLLNASNPVWDVDVKVMVNNDTWQVGNNNRVHVTLADDLLQVKLCPYFLPTSTSAQHTMSQIFSPQLNNSRDVWIYVPAAMVENTACSQATVLIMHDGQNLAPLWGVPGHLDTAIAAGTIGPVFVIGPYNTPDRIAEYTYSVDPTYGGGKGNLYLDFLQGTLMPAVVAAYPTLALVVDNPSKVGIVGSSLGGLISCYAAVTRPKSYHLAGCMSSSFWWNSADFASTIVPQIIPYNVQFQKYYMDSGGSGDCDDDRPFTSQVASLMVRSDFTLGYNLYWYLERAGHHNEYWWSRRFPVLLSYLLGRDALLNDDPGPLPPTMKRPVSQPTSRKNL